MMRWGHNYVCCGYTTTLPLEETARRVLQYAYSHLLRQWVTLRLNLSKSARFGGLT